MDRRGSSTHTKKVQYSPHSAIVDLIKHMCTATFAIGLADQTNFGIIFHGLVFSENLLGFVSLSFTKPTFVSDSFPQSC